MHTIWIPAGMPTHNITLLSLLFALCPPILPGAQRCWPRALAEFRGSGVEVNVTASLRVTHLITLLSLLFDLSPRILSVAQRCWPRALAEFRGIAVEVNVTASSRVSECDRFFACQ